MMNAAEFLDAAINYPDTFRVKGTTFHFPTLPFDGLSEYDRAKEITRRRKLIERATKARGRIKLGTSYGSGRYVSGSGLPDAPLNIMTEKVSLATVKMPAAAGETIRQHYSDNSFIEVTVWSPGPDNNSVWATTEGRRFVLMRYSPKSGEWFEDKG